jgi:outer membrane receptor protein involved in Fe transport
LRGRIGLLALALLAIPILARAQAPPGAAKPAEATVSGVTVVAPTQEVRSSIERRSYSVAKDLQATSGTLADVLNNIPSVAVDVQGNLTLRGDANVTVLVDGKPSAEFRGPNRAQALQQLPASEVDRIEVITNPSAAFNPEGSGGIINIVTKPVRKAGWSGSLRAGAGQRRGYSAGLTASYGGRRLTGALDMSVRGDPQRFGYSETRTLAPGGPYRTSHDSRLLLGRGRSAGAHGTLDYDLDPRDRLSLEARVNALRVSQDGGERFEGFDAGGATTLAFDTSIPPSPYARDASQVGVAWRRQFDGSDHELTINVQREWIDNDFVRPQIILGVVPPAPAVLDRLHTVQDQTLSDAKADYVRPLAGGTFKAGVEWEVQKDDFAGETARGRSQAALVQVPGLTGEFLYRQSVASAYATYERRLGRFTALAGLRLERVRLAFGGPGAPLERQAYGRAYPSLHLAYALSEDQTLTASYSRRVVRPPASALDPVPLFADPLNVFVGDPDLKPQETDSYQLAYELKRSAADIQASLFFRRTRDSITTLVTPLKDGVLSNAQANVGVTRSGGFEVTASGKLPARFSYNLTTDLYWNEVAAPNLGFTGSRSGYAVSGQANLTWQATPDDLLQANAWASGKRLTPQGHREPAAVLNLGYRHRLTRDLFAALTVSDVFSSFQNTDVFDTPVLKDRQKRTGMGTVVQATLTWQFGGEKPRAPGFDFGGPGS